MTTTQLNIRVPFAIKEKAQKKAAELGTNVNFLVKLFLSSFIKNDSVEIKHSIDLEKVFDVGFIEHLMSSQGKKQVREINILLEDVIKDEESYLV